MGVIGTGASGVQVIEQATKVAQYLSVFQRTPMLALAMQQQHYRDSVGPMANADFPQNFRRQRAARGGIADIVQDDRSAVDVPAAEREDIFEAAWNKGGFHF